ncbi:hypothetical protein AAG570_011113 [Ranatra chinensis]|uniref:Uncharacterized protein n=1 Tax=Ranatra chinensis TaxID=642074 RepID=A0ABD0YJY6_9HEMI
MAIALSVTSEEGIDENGRVYMKPFCKMTRLSKETMQAYRLVLVSLQYVIPLCVVSCAYVRMALKLWGSKAPGNAQDSRDANLMRNKKKVTFRNYCMILLSLLLV